MPILILIIIALTLPLMFLSNIHADDNQLGVAIIPYVTDSAEKKLHEEMGQISDIDYVHNVKNTDELFKLLGRYASQKRLINNLVIGGHGGLTKKENKYVGIMISPESGGNLSAIDIDLKNYRNRIEKTQKFLDQLDDSDPSTWRRKQKNEAILNKDKRAVEFLERATKAFAPDARIILYNCNPLDTDEGKAFVEDLGQLLLGERGGSIVAASGKVNLNNNYLPLILGRWLGGKDLIVDANWHTIRIDPEGKQKVEARLKEEERKKGEGEGERMNKEDSDGVEIILPNMVGMSYEKAVGIIESAGLNTLPPKLGSPTTDKDKVGTVEKAVPEHDGPLKANDSVTLFIHDEQIVSSKVPNVIGQTLKAASDSIKTAGLNPLIELGEETSEPNNKGIIYRQVPEAGVEVAAGSNVSLLVYNFVVRTEIVPNVIGQQLSTAADAIKEAGLTPILELGNETDDPKKEGTIYSQNPASGTELLAESDVTLFVYSLTINTHSVPNVIGKELGIAANIVKQAGFNPILELGDVTKDPKKDRTIYSQAPAPRTEIEAGGKVTLLVFSLIEGLDGLPNVIGKELGEAADAIKQAGFNPLLELGKDTSDSDKDGIIYSQSPAPGTSIEAGSDVTLLVYTYVTDKAVVPNLMGLSHAEARHALKASGLFTNLNNGKEAPTNSDQGMVYKQYPEPGFEVMGGIGIDIWVYAGDIDQSNSQENGRKKITSERDRQLNTKSGGVPHIDVPANLFSIPFSGSFSAELNDTPFSGGRIIRPPRGFRSKYDDEQSDFRGFDAAFGELTKSPPDFAWIWWFWLEPGDTIPLGSTGHNTESLLLCQPNGNNIRFTTKDNFYTIAHLNNRQLTYSSSTGYASLGLSVSENLMASITEEKMKELAEELLSQIEPFAKRCNE